jgi:hydrogenase maturation protein HypF
LSAPEKGISAIEIIKNMVDDFQNGNPKDQLILNFLYTLAFSIIEIAKSNNYEHVAFSGGVFQNTTLVDIIIELAPKEIKLYFHKDLSPNDENISFGQLMYYLNIIK